jgi:FkbM family methyltransferase
MIRWGRILLAHPKPFRLVAAKLLVWTGLSRFLTLQLDGYRLRFYPSNATTNLWIVPDSRSHGLELFRDYAKPGDAVVDVGANVGEVAILTSQRVGPTGSVLAFEPSPRIYGYLRGNLELNGCRNVTTRNAALGAAAGSARMTDDRRDDMNRLDADGGVPVECSTLDIEVPAQVRPALIKVDVEGTELSVLKGGADVLSRTACVNCEMWASHFERNGYTMGDLIAFLRSAGFSPFVIHAGPSLRPVDETFAEPGGHELVAVRDVNAFLHRTGWSLHRERASAG